MAGASAGSSSPPNGRIKPDWVEVDERQEKHSEGAYYLDWTEDFLRKRIAVGSDATAAYNSLKKKQSELDAIARGLVVTDPVKEGNARLRLSAAKADFLEDIQLSCQRKTWLGYCLSLSYFVECCSKTYVEDIERKDLQAGVDLRIVVTWIRTLGHPLKTKGHPALRIDRLNVGDFAFPFGAKRREWFPLLPGG